MTGKKKAEPKAEVKEAVNEEVKEDKISLIVFKQIENIDNMTYTGFKASLEAEDGTEASLSEFKREYAKYRDKKVFIKR